MFTQTSLGVLCFELSGGQQFLDKVFSEQRGEPALFSCRDYNSLYLARCVAEECYLVVRVSDDTLRNLRHGKISVRDAFMMSDWYWDVNRGDAVCKSIKCVPEILLPDDSVFYSRWRRRLYRKRSRRLSWRNKLLVMIQNASNEELGEMDKRFHYGVAMERQMHEKVCTEELQVCEAIEKEMKCRRLQSCSDLEEDIWFGHR